MLSWPQGSHNPKNLVMSISSCSPYLDCNATSLCDGRVWNKISLREVQQLGNPASIHHRFGWDAAQAVEDARSHVGALIGAQPHEVLFTSGATESINTALQWSSKSSAPRTIVTCLTEHDAVLNSCRTLQKNWGCMLRFLTVNVDGQIDHNQARALIREANCSFCALMLANNETGVIHSLRPIGHESQMAGVPILSDITQAVGRIPVDVRELGIDIAAFSSHKIYGPMGVGALYVRGGQPEIKLQPLIVGGGQERGLRGGTLNVPGIVGFGEACRIAKEDMESDNERIVKLRDRLEATLMAELPDIWINGAGAERLCNTSNIGFRGVDARTMIRDMHDIACSTKSACSSGDSAPSHVLKAIGLTDDEAYSCIRFSLGRFTTEQEIDYALEKIIGSVRKLRRIAGSAGTSPERRP